MNKNNEILSELEKTKARRGEKTVTLSTRLNRVTNELIMLISAIEDRTVSKVLQRLIERGLREYFNETDNLQEYFDFFNTLKSTEIPIFNGVEKQSPLDFAHELESYINQLRN